MADPAQTETNAPNKGKGASKAALSDTKRPVEIVRLTDIENANYGDLELVQSQTKTNRRWTQLKDVSGCVGEGVWLRARVHNIRKKSNKMMFIVLREGLHLVQGIIYENKDDGVDREMVKYCSRVPAESIVDLYAKVEKSQIRIKTATFHDIELKIKKMFVVSASQPTLPFQLDSASNKFGSREDNEKQLISVGRSLRLDYRYIDLRSDVNYAIFTVKSAVCKFFREYLTDRGFIEIQSPKIVGGASEGGADVFTVDYFGQKACLAQSPQLYKQMAISCDLGRVFEVGPVFRAENSNTHRHLTEFTGLDFEMPIYEHFSEVLDIAGDLFVYTFDKLKANFAAEIETVSRAYGLAALEYSKETERVTFEEAVVLIRAEAGRLRESGKSEAEVEEMGGVVKDDQDFTTLNEKLLGKIMKEKYRTDYYIVYRYPQNARPFYTMPAPDNPAYTNSYDFFLRGEEIISGAQRIHDPALLTQRARACGVALESIKDYVDSFRYGMRPHGGVGVGLERVVMLFFGLDNVRECSLFPRDPKRLSP